MVKNIFDKIKIDKEKEIFEILFQNRVVKIEKIVSNGQTSKPNFWYNQDEIEFVILLSGKAQIEFEDKIINLKKGDYHIISAYCKHRVAFTDLENSTIWLAIFIKP